MRQIKFDRHIVETRDFRRYYAQYTRKKGYETPIAELPECIAKELWVNATFCYTARDMKVGEEFEIELFEGKKILCKKENKYSVNFELNSMADVFEIDKDDPLWEAYSNPNNFIVLGKDEVFRHPLTKVDTTKINGEVQEIVNGYGLASLLIDVIRNPDISEDDGKMANESFARFILESGNNANIQVLLERIKAGELRAMMTASTYINDGFEKTVHNALNNQ